ncbi:ribonuclease E/G [Lichenicoccus roseus]|uniref:ribonuclease E/G n=1 Tax=Lichenicoccus roseus TaxID=2683649 RepID=UPI00148757FE|nr:ribonuclease E/G [Lichenicoccus roseus]
MKARILASCSPGEVRIAVVEETGAGHAGLLDYDLHRPGAPDGVGDLYQGHIEAVVPALAGAFVRIGDLSGFLPDRDGANGPGDGEGARIAVRITRAAQGGKGPRLSGRLEPPERALVARHGDAPGLVARGPGALQRLAMRYPEAPILADAAGMAAALPAALRERVRLVPRAFDDDVEDRAEQLARPEVDLPGGMRASIQPTAALVAIDMDLAAGTAERRPKQTVQFAANRAAIAPLLHQLRLRNLSGAILIDLAGLAARKRSALAPEITAALQRDPLQPRLLGFTALGFAELLRPRVHPPLHELLQSPHGAGLAALRRVAGQVHHRPGRAINLRGGIPLIEALHADPVALPAFEQATAVTISLQMDPALPATAWMLADG